jgi:hypothetical protein
VAEVPEKRHLYFGEGMDSSGIRALSTIVILYFTTDCMGMPHAKVLRI